MRKWVEYAVENYKGKNTFGFQLAKDLKERQIERAIERYAKGVRPDEVAAILDTSAFRSGKTGFLLTDRYLYSDKCKEEGPIGLMFLKSVSIKPENNSCCVLTFDDGSIREIDVSVFLDVADVLKLIIEQRQKAEAEEKEQMSPSAQKGTDGADQGSEADSAKELMDFMNQGGSESRVDFEDSDGTEALKPGADTVNQPSFKELENSHEPGTTGMAIEIVGIEDLADQKESEEARKMRWLADFIQSEEGDWGDDTGTFQAGRPEKDWIDEMDEKPAELPKEQSGPESEEDVMEEAARQAAEYEELLEKAEAGDRAAMFQVAELSYAGEKTVKDHKQALRWFRESAKAEYVPAMLQMMRF